MVEKLHSMFVIFVYLFMFPAKTKLLLTVFTNSYSNDCFILQTIKHTLK